MLKVKIQKTEFLVIIYLPIYIIIYLFLALGTHQPLLHCVL